MTMLDRCYLTEGMPTMLLWGDRDSVVPVRHAYGAHQAVPGEFELEIFEGAGHFPFHSDPARFLALVEEFASTTSPADWSREHWRELLRAGRPARRPAGPAPQPGGGARPARGERTQRDLTPMADEAVAADQPAAEPFPTAEGARRRWTPALRSAHCRRSRRLRVAARRFHSSAVRGGSVRGGRRGPRSTATATSGLTSADRGAERVDTARNAWATRGRPAAVRRSRST